MSLVVFGLSTNVGSGSCAEGTADGVCGGEGGGGGDGGGGDPVEQEPPLPRAIDGRCRSLLLSLGRFKFNRSCILEGQIPIHGDGPPLPSRAGGDGAGGHVADGEGLQGGGGGACAHKEQLWLAGNLIFSAPVCNCVKKGNNIKTYTATVNRTTRRLTVFILVVSPRPLWTRHSTASSFMGGTTGLRGF